MHILNQTCFFCSLDEVEAAEAAETGSIRLDMERSESCKHKSHDTTQDPVAEV